MRKPLVKICGITNPEDAYICLENGANLLGFIFYEKSPRKADPDTVRDIIISFNKKYSFESVGVFVNPTKEFANKIIDITGIEILQFHGEETPSFIKNFNKKKIKAFRIKDKSDILYCDEYIDIDYFLFDTYIKELYGGTGKVFDWNMLEGFKYRDRLFLSGGIDINNVVDAIMKVNPYAIDISSSLEIKPGDKDHEKIKKFFLKIRKL